MVVVTASDGRRRHDCTTQTTAPGFAVIGAALFAALATGIASSAASTKSAPSWARRGPATRPTIDPANFVCTIDNRYFPLKPGTGFHYKGVRGDARRRPTTRS